MELLQPVLAMLVLLALVGGMAAGLAVWFAAQPEGTAWLTARLPGVEVKGLQGALLSERFSIERLTVRWGNAQEVVIIHDLQAQGLRWHWHPSSGAWVGLDAQRLQARRVEVLTGPPGPRPIQMPRSLQMPLRLQAAEVEIGDLQIDALPPMQNVQGRNVSLWDPGGREYRAERITMDWDRARIDGSVSLGANPPFTLQAAAALSARDTATRWPSGRPPRPPRVRWHASSCSWACAARHSARAPPPRCWTPKPRSPRWRPGRWPGCVCAPRRWTCRPCSARHTDRLERPHGHRQPLAHSAGVGHRGAGQRHARPLGRRPRTGAAAAGAAAQPRRQARPAC